MRRMSSFSSLSQVFRHGTLLMWMPLGVLLCSVLLNVVQARQLETTRSHTARSVPAGTPMPALEGVDMAGKKIRVAYAGMLPTILYHFSPTCSWCERNRENLRSLIQETAGRYRVIGISAARPTAEFMRERQFDFPVITGISPDAMRAYGLGGTPQTLVVSPEGRLIETWTGAYVHDQAKAIERFFSIQLPGLVERAAAPGRQ